MIHGFITTIYCFIFYYVSKYFGCFTPEFFIVPAVFYIGREFTQAEYRYIEGYCSGRRVFMPTFAMFYPSAWTLKSLFDWIIPCLVSAFFFYISVNRS